MAKSAVARPSRLRTLLTAQHASQPQSIRLRDGELVVYRRSRSLLFQCRYRLADGRWVRQTTGRAALEHAIARACDIYDEARYRQRLGLAHRTHSVAQIAAIRCAALRQQIDAKGKKTALNDYVSIIERYFVPYFGERQLETLTHTDVREFEMWRDRQMTRKPKTSTLNNFTSAWSRLVATAVEQGYISERVPVPKLTSRGQKGKTRPAFSKEEIDVLLAFMEQWSQQGRMAVEREIRPLLRDYVEMLLYTGMRHGTEAMGIRWRDLEWHTKDGVRYLRVWVDGKTGGRWLIAKHKAVDVLRRLHARQKDIGLCRLKTCWQLGCRTCCSGSAMGFAAAGRAAGVEIREGSPVIAVDSERGRVTGVRTPDASIATPVVVDAAVPSAAEVSRLAGVALPIAPYRRQVFVTGAFAPLPAPLPMVIDFKTHFYFRREGAGILFGMTDAAEPLGFHTHVDWAFLERVVERALHRIPVLASAGVMRGWAGLYDTTPDNNPILGTVPDLEGFIVAAGFSGHGFMLSPAVGACIAELPTTGAAATVDITPLGVERFRAGRARAETAII